MPHTDGYVRAETLNEPHVNPSHRTILPYDLQRPQKESSVLSKRQKKKEKTDEQTNKNKEEEEEEEKEIKIPRDSSYQRFYILSLRTF